MTRMTMYGYLINADMTLQQPNHTVEIICKASVVQTVRESLMTDKHNNNNDDNTEQQQQQQQWQWQWQYRNCIFVNEIEQCYFLKTIKITVRLPVSDRIGSQKEFDKNPLTKFESLRMELHHWEHLPGLACDPDSVGNR